MIFDKSQNMKHIFLTFLILLSFLFNYLNVQAQRENEYKNFPIAIMAYYTGNGIEINQYRVDQLTHLIFSFLHVRDNCLTVDSPADSITLLQLVALKKQYPHLKVMVSMGGWGGCAPCSTAFSTAKGRQDFARSTKQILDTYHLDGIDLDWEYPAIQGYPGHQFSYKDKNHFTELIKSLRHELGKNKIISFAAGGFDTYLRYSVNWRKVVPLVNYVNLMSYDLVNGYSKVTGLHTPLYSSPHQPESVNHAVQYLDSIHVDMHKIVIGAAFYARVWTAVPDTNHGLFQPGKFTAMVNYKDFDSYFSVSKGFVFYWDKASEAPYCYSPKEHAFGTFDNIQSVELKTKYVKEHHLGGIMFWELTCDKPRDGLLNAIYQTSVHK